MVDFQGFQPARNRQGAYKGGVLLTREGCFSQGRGASHKGGVLLTREGCFSQRRGLVERGHAEVGSFLKTC